MIIKIRNYTLAAIVVGGCILGFMGPIMYPELMVNATYMPLI